MNKIQLQDALRSATEKPESGFLGVAPCQVQTFWGGQLQVMLPELVSTTIAFSRLYEKDLTFLLIEFLMPGSVFVDIGAHFGYFSLLGAHLVGPGGEVHSFEPTPTTFSILEQNLAHYSYVHLNNLAVYSESASLSFRDLGIEGSAFNSLFEPRLSQEARKSRPGQMRTVQAISVDEYVEQKGIKPDFIKVDAESAEFQILQGMKKTLAGIRPMFTLEVGDSEVADVPSSAELIRCACSFGYGVYKVQEGEVVRHAIRSKYGYDNLLFIPE